MPRQIKKATQLICKLQKRTLSYLPILKYLNSDFINKLFHTITQWGLRGLRGLRGFSGFRGLRGLRGLRGSRGEGLSGLSGLRGLRGLSG